MGLRNPLQQQQSCHTRTVEEQRLDNEAQPQEQQFPGSTGVDKKPIRPPEGDRKKQLTVESIKKALAGRRALERQHLPTFRR